MDAFNTVFGEVGNATQTNAGSPRRGRPKKDVVEPQTARIAPSSADAFNAVFGEADTNAGAKVAAPRRKTRERTSAAANTKMAASSPATNSKRKKVGSVAEISSQTPSSPRRATHPTKSCADKPGASISDGQPPAANLAGSAIGTGLAGHANAENQCASASEANIIQIVQLWRMRQRWHRAEKSLVLQGKAICRSFCDGDKTKASAMFDEARKGKLTSNEILFALAPFVESADRFEDLRLGIEKQMKGLAKALPAYEWIKSVKGFGELNFVAIVGEASVIEEDGSLRTIGNYKTVSGLWKRMGLAVIDGQRQRKVADAELALLHGYSPSRRSVMYNVGECLFKAGSPKYREYYDTRKAYELARDENIKLIHAHKRALRYMSKKALRDLYAAWRRETIGEVVDPENAWRDKIPLAAE